MDPTFVVYVDESGDEGFKFGQGSSDWFILSAVVLRRTDDAAIVNLADSIRAALGKKPRTPLHFRELKHEQRVRVTDELARFPLKTVSVLVHKPSISEPEKFRKRYRLYYYAARYLLERVSWYCRDHRKSQDKGDGSAYIIFSNRAGMSYSELRKYIELLKTQTNDFGFQLECDVVKSDQIDALSSGKRAGLQVADAVASGFFYAAQINRYGFTEDRYARMMAEVVYKRGRYRGYGLKFWPREADTAVERGELCKWFSECYLK